MRRDLNNMHQQPLHLLLTFPVPSLYLSFMFDMTDKQTYRYTHMELPNGLLSWLLQMSSAAVLSVDVTRCIACVASRKLPASGRLSRPTLLMCDTHCRLIAKCIYKHRHQRSSAFPSPIDMHMAQDYGWDAVPSRQKGAKTCPTLVQGYEKAQ